MLKKPVLKYVVSALMVIVVAFAAIVALQPPDFRVTRSAAIAAPPEGNRTVVAWTMSGKNNFLSKAIGLFMDCDKMVGGQFEKGLAQMKSIAEAET